MKGEAVLGKCESCGHHVRIPHSDHVYVCKSCGGRVHAMVEEPADVEVVPVGAEVAPAAPRVKHTARAAPPEQMIAHPTRHHARHGQVSAHAAHHEHDPEHPHRHHHHVKHRSMPSWLLTSLIALVLGGAVFGTYKVLWAGHGVDLNATNEDFVEAWSKGDVDALTRFHHPQGRDTFRASLATIAEHRGWKGTFPAVDRSTAVITSGTADDPDRGMSMLYFGAEWARLEWQFEPSRNDWLVYALDVTPLPIGPRVASFREAWKQSQLGDLQPFMRTEARAKWNEFLTRKLAALKWTSAHPELGTARIVGEEIARHPLLEALSSQRVESIFPLPDGREFKVNWGFLDSSDEWVITGFEFP